MRHSREGNRLDHSCGVRPTLGSSLRYVHPISRESGGAQYDSNEYRAGNWFAGYLGLVVMVRSLLQSYLRATNHLSPNQMPVFISLNIGAVSAIAFVLPYTFVRQRNALLALLGR